MDFWFLRVISWQSNCWHNCLGLCRHWDGYVTMEITGAPTGLDSAQATLIESRPMHIGRGLRGNWQCGRGQGQMRGLGGIRGQGWVCDQGSRNNRGILQRKSDVCRWTRTGVQTVSESVKDLQSLEMLDMSLRAVSMIESVVQWFRGGVAAQMRQKMRRVYETARGRLRQG